MGVRRSHPLPIFALLAAAACAPAETPPVDTTADREAIDALARQEMQALVDGDIVAHLATHAPDAVVMPPGMPAARGLDAIRGVLEEMHAQFDLDGRYTDLRTTVVGDVAYQECAFDLTLTEKVTGNVITEVGKGVHVLRKQPDGTWKIALDVWNSSSAPAGM